MNAKIEKRAKDLKLKVLDYRGFVRGAVWDGEITHCGAWEFKTLPEYDTNEEPMNVFAYNLVDALDQMKENAQYFYSNNEV